MNVEEHEAKLKQLNAKYLAGTMSREDVQNEITHLFGEDNPTFQLKEALTREVNSRISWKAREKMSVEQYFRRREQIMAEILNADKIAEQEAKEEDARMNGICLVCGSKCRSKGKEWICGSCGKRFRKRGT